MTRKLSELVASISPETIERFMVKQEIGSTADRNEMKYASVQTEEDRWNLKHHGVYSEILSGTDNGNCSTRRTTYFKLKQKK